MKLKLLFPFLAYTLSTAIFADESSSNKETALFNGKDLTGWHVDVPAADENPKIEPSFTVREGLLVSLGNPRGHLITDASYENYRLELEYRFANKAGNCGVLVHSSTPRALFEMFPASIEVQLQSGHAGDFWCISENIEVENMKKRRPRKKGQEYGGAKGQARRIKNLTDDSEKPVGEWNKMVIECKADEVIVWVNDVLVNHGKKSTAKKGQIALQAEGAEVEFKSLSLSPLKK